MIVRFTFRVLLLTSMILLAACAVVPGSGSIATNNPTPNSASTSAPSTPNPQPSRTSEPIAGAEAIESQAKGYPSAAPPSPIPLLFQKTLGTAERKCIKADTSDMIRSGEFVAGNFRVYIEQWKPDSKLGKLWWNPLHSEAMKSLTVRAIPLENPSSVRTFGQSWIVEGEDGTRGYATNIPLPTRGTWRLIATTGPDWGCFELTLK